MANMLPSMLVLTAFLAAYTVSAGVSLKQDERLAPGGTLVGVDGCTLTYQTDGNLVLNFKRGAYSSVMWAADTGSDSPGHLIMQGDGNLVAYDAGGKPYWSGNSFFEIDNVKGVGAPFRVDLEDSCNFVLFNSAELMLWSTETGNVKRTILQDVKFDRDAILVSLEEPTCWMRYYRTFSSMELALYKGKQELWREANSIRSTTYMKLSSLGQFQGWVLGAFSDSPTKLVWGKADQGVEPYEFKIASDGAGSCVVQISDAEGTILFTKAND